MKHLSIASIIIPLLISKFSLGKGDLPCRAVDAEKLVTSGYPMVITKQQHHIEKRASEYLDENQLSKGDLLFITAPDTKLSRAISAVTQTGRQDDFSHIAILDVEQGHPWILHSSTEHGSERITLREFKVRTRAAGSRIIVYRVHPKYRVDQRKVVKRATAMLGKPYNFTYRLSDSAYYCSDFVYHALNDTAVFKMKAMTFKDPKTGEVNNVWLEYYKKLNTSIPEGEPGCHPNGMAASPALVKIGELKLDLTPSIKEG